jgi:hypothetical protein
VLAPEQDSVRQHAQGHQGHWHQEAIPEVLSLEEACLFPKRNKLTSPFTYKEKKKKALTIICILIAVCGHRWCWIEK